MFGLVQLLMQFGAEVEDAEDAREHNAERAQAFLADHGHLVDALLYALLLVVVVVAVVYLEQVALDPR